MQPDLEALAVAMADDDVPVAIRDGAGRYVRVNAAYAALLGLAAERVEGKADGQLHPADLARTSAAHDGEVLGSGEPREDGEVLLGRDGRVGVRALRTPLVDQTGPWAVLVVLATGEDLRPARATRDRLAALAAGPVEPAAPPAPGAAQAAREQALAGRAEAAEGRVGELEARAEAAERRAHDLANRVMEAEALAEELTDRTHELTARAAAAEEGRDAAEARCDDLVARLADADAVRGAAERRAEELAARLAEAETRAIALADRLEGAEARHRDAEVLLARERREAPPAQDEPVVPGRWTAADEARLDAALARASVPQTAARAVLTTFGPAAGLRAAAVWRREPDGGLRPLGVWTAPGTPLGTWESATWHATVREGALAAAADGHALVGPPPAGDPWGADGHAAGFGAVALLPAGPGTALELALAPEGDLLEAAQAVAGRLGDALARLAEQGHERAWL